MTDDLSTASTYEPTWHRMSERQVRTWIEHLTYSIDRNRPTDSQRERLARAIANARAELDRRKGSR